MGRKKTFCRSPEQIRPLVEGYGGCVASDEITVKGRRVGFAFRDPPDRPEDSGWTFTAGDESDDYINDTENLGVYDVNTIANIDPEIIPWLFAKPGSSVGRDRVTGRFVRIDPGAPDVDPDDFPTIEGEYAMTDTWTIHLPEGVYKRRLEDGQLVIWRPRLTAWIIAFQNDGHQSVAERARVMAGRRSPEAYDFLEEQKGAMHRFSYRLLEESDEPVAAALYGFAVGRSGHVQMAIYFDDDDELESATAMWRGLSEGFGGGLDS
jgi:hypothetical protein